MDFKLYQGEKSFLISNTDNALTLHTFLSKMAFQDQDSGYNIMIVHKGQGANDANWSPTRLFPVYMQLESDVIDKLEILNGDKVIMTFPSLYVSYRMSNSNSTLGSDYDSNDRLQERLEFVFTVLSDLSKVEVSDGSKS